jgi:hypothetical protein
MTTLEAPQGSFQGSNSGKNQDPLLGSPFLWLEEEDKQSLDGAWFLSPDKEDKQTHLDTTLKMRQKTKRLVITLKDAIDMAMS